MEFAHIELPLLVYCCRYIMTLRQWLHLYVSLSVGTPLTSFHVWHRLATSVPHLEPKLLQQDGLGTFILAMQLFMLFFYCSIVSVVIIFMFLFNFISLFILPVKIPASVIHEVCFSLEVLLATRPNLESKHVKTTRQSPQWLVNLSTRERRSSPFRALSQQRAYTFQPSG